MASARFRQMERQVRHLRRALLPAEIELADLTVDFSRDGDVSLRTSAFVVSCHAEFESFLEERSHHVAQFGVDRWLKHQKLTMCALSLLTFHVRGTIPDSLLAVGAPKYDDSDITPLLRSALSQHESRLQKNHGIKEKDVVAMLLPIGVRMQSLPGAAVAELDTYGSVRGNNAHNHQKHAVRVSINVRDESARASRVVAALETIDVALVQLST